MGVKVAKDAIDLGIVTTNGDAMLSFYRDVLGFKHEGDITMEQVLKQLGFEPISRSGFQWHGPCPVHGSTSTTGGTFSVNLSTRRYYCHKCHSKGNHLELWAAITGFQFTRLPSIFAALSDMMYPGSAAGDQEQIEKRHRYSGSREAIAIDYLDRQSIKYLAHSHGGRICRPLT